MMQLVTEYFASNDRRRAAEVLLTLHENLSNELITQIHLFKTQNDPLHFESPKMRMVSLPSRPTVAQLFAYANEHISDDICAIANSDIFFNDTLKIAQSICAGHVFLALSRWDLVFRDVGFEYRLFDNPASQDTWMFRPHIRLPEGLNFCLGTPGCDNRIAWEFHKLGFSVRNPSKRIVTAHFHTSATRTPNVFDRVPGPYLMVVPTNRLDEDSRFIELDDIDTAGLPFLSRFDGG